MADVPQSPLLVVSLRKSAESDPIMGIISRSCATHNLRFSSSCVPWSSFKDSPDLPSHSPLSSSPSFIQTLAPSLTTVTPSLPDDAVSFVLISDSRKGSPDKLARAVRKVSQSPSLCFLRPRCASIPTDKTIDTKIRGFSKKIFICVWSPAVCSNPLQRMQLFDRVCNMITEDEESLSRALCTVDQQNQQALLVQSSRGKIKGLSHTILSLS